MLTINRVPKKAISRIAKEDPWHYVLDNFLHLSEFYAYRYSSILRDEDSWHDHKVDILYEMVQAYIKYRQTQNLPMVQVVKILKTCPAYYYQNVICRLANKVERVSLDLVSGTLLQEEMPDNLFDRYLIALKQGRFARFQRGRAEYEKRDEMNAERHDAFSVLSMILEPSDTYKKYIQQKGREFRLSNNSLQIYFVQKLGWNKNRFNEAVQNVRQFFRLEE